MRHEPGHDPRAADCDAIVLAAGLSSRMPGTKMLLTVGGRPLVRIAIDHALTAVRRVILVVGHDSDAVAAAAVGEAGTRPAAARDGARFAGGPGPDRLVVVRNPHYRDGMFGSIQAGMRFVASEWFFVVPGDMPGLEPRIYVRIAAEAPHVQDPPFTRDDGAEPPPRAIVPYYQGTRGHPVLVHRSLIPGLLAEPRDAGPMRDLLARSVVRRLNLDEPSITVDLDTDEALRRYRAADGSRGDHNFGTSLRGLRRSLDPSYTGGQEEAT